jgi:hypothetical protein
MKTRKTEEPVAYVREESGKAPEISPAALLL